MTEAVFPFVLLFLRAVAAARGVGGTGPGWFTPSPTRRDLGSSPALTCVPVSHVQIFVGARAQTNAHTQSSATPLLQASPGRRQLAAVNCFALADGL